MDENTYIGESVPGDVIPNAGYLWDFSPIQQSAQSLTGMIASTAAAEKKEAKENKKFWESKMQDLPDVWTYDYDKVNLAKDEYNNIIQEFINEGKDPDDLQADDKKRLDEALNKLSKTKILADENQSIWEENKKIILADADKQKYDKDVWGSYETEVLNPNLSVQDRNKILKDKNGLVRVYSWDEILDATKNEKTTNEQGITTITRRDPENYKAYLQKLIDVKDEDILKYYESKKRQAERDVERDENGAVKNQNDVYTTDDFINQAVNLLTAFSGTSVVQDEPKAPSRSPGSSSNYKGKNYTWGWDSAGTEVTVDGSNISRVINDITPIGGTKPIKGASIGRFYIENGRVVFDAMYKSISGLDKKATFDYELNKSRLTGYPDMKKVLEDRPGYSRGKSKSQDTPTFNGQ